MYVTQLASLSNIGFPSWNLKFYFLFITLIDFLSAVRSFIFLHCCWVTERPVKIMYHQSQTKGLSLKDLSGEDTVKPSLPAWEINLKACAPEIRTWNLPVDPGIEPRLLRQTVPVDAHCVSANWATEAGKSSIYSHLHSVWSVKRNTLLDPLNSVSTKAQKSSFRNQRSPLIPECACLYWGLFRAYPTGSHGKT